jgi:hypothetical protein
MNLYAARHKTTYEKVARIPKGTRDTIRISSRNCKRTLMGEKHFVLLFLQRNGRERKSGVEQ